MSRLYLVLGLGGSKGHVKIASLASRITCVYARVCACVLFVYVRMCVLCVCVREREQGERNVKTKTTYVSKLIVHCHVPNVKMANCENILWTKHKTN